MKSVLCEYKRKCNILPNEFCSTDDRFSCVVYRNKEEEQMKYEDDL